MLIGIDASRAASVQRTGTERYSLFLIRALLDAGCSHRFRLYFNQPPQPGLFERDDRVEWRVMPFPRLWTHLRLAWEVLCSPPDVLFVPSHVLPLIHSRRCVATVHDLGYRHYPDSHTRAARWYLDWSTRFNARTAQRVVVDSEATRRDLATFYGTDPAVTVLAYPAGTEGYAPVHDMERLAAVRRRYATGSQYLLYLGTLQPRKNLGTLIKAFASLVEADRIPSSLNLVLAGKRGWLYDRIQADLHTASLQDRIVLPGYIEEDDVAPLMSGATAFCLPSWYEGFGLPVLEAMACDTPVICSNVSSLPEVAGDAALLFDPARSDELAHAIERLVRDPARRRDLVSRGRRQVQRFSWEGCAARVLEALETVGAGGTR